MIDTATAPAAARAGLALASAVFLLWCLALASATPAPAAPAAWHFAPAAPPAPPAGVPPSPFPVPVGEVGEISFWAPNRGLLIAGGNETVVPGVYAYDGVSWHQLSTVCGGQRGRIAWAGPDEFWTIADQRPGQILPPQGRAELRAISLCHFVGDQVVASYAMPLDQPGAYLRMDAAACYGPSDCWFGGADGQGPDVGAFHLHWDGSSVTTVYEPEDHAVTDMVNFDGQLYESVQIGGGDAWLPCERPQDPAVFHKIAPAGQLGSSCGIESPFSDVVIFTSGHSLPEYGKEVPPDALQGFSLASEGPVSDASAAQLWAAADPVYSGKPAPFTVLRYAKSAHGEWTWSQVLPNPQPTSPPLPPEETLGSEEPARTVRGALGLQDEAGAGEAIAPEPGTDSAWLSLGERYDAGVARLEARTPEHPGEATGVIAETAILPVEAIEPSPVGSRGLAGPITCPAPHDCWMATAELGWLFHLTDGAAQPPDTDPLFDGEDGVISYRPPDASVPVIYPDAPPEDDSGDQQAPPVAPVEFEVAPAPRRTPSPARPLVVHVHTRFLRGRVLEITFTLTARAHVQLIGRRRHAIVARTRRETLRPGPHRLSLTLDPRRWPTKLQFEATPLMSSSGGTEGGGSSNSSSPDTIGT